VTDQYSTKTLLLQHFFSPLEHQFRMQLLQMEKDTVTTRTENESLRAVLGQERQKASALENRIIIHESCIDELNYNAN
jgi:BMFP domain-containing protein YqiC